MVERPSIARIVMNLSAKIRLSLCLSLSRSLALRPLHRFRTDRDLAVAPGAWRGGERAEWPWREVERYLLYIDM